jgi:quinone-modifying oxidoreductase, subunit QmoB
MDNKLGVYICKGCGIGECLDTEHLVEIAKSEHSAPIVRTSAAFCLEDVQIIKDDIERQGIRSAVIAACSSRVNTDIFSLKPAMVQRVNLREQVAWSHAPNTEETQSLAEDYLRMGVIRAQKTETPVPYSATNERTILVIGGGITGMTAALDAADAGFGVVLVEKQAFLGGFAAEIHRHFPGRPSYERLEENPTAELIRKVQAHPDIRLILSAKVEGIEGQPGQFVATVRQDQVTHQFQAGAVVMATGWKVDDAARLETYGLGKYANVVTSATVEQMAGRGAIVRPSDGREARTVAIVQGGSSANGDDLLYGGNVTSLVMLKQAMYFREANPHAAVYVIYQNLQTPGQYEYLYRRVQRDEGIFFSRGDIRSVTEDEQRNLILDLENSLLGPSVRLQADMLVLPVEMVPAAASSAPLNLHYLQGKELPPTQSAFADSRFICFPYETRRTGIYSAGCCRQTMDMPSSAQDGTAGALKAIQCIENSAMGSAVHPRSGDLTYPKFFMQKCTSCGRCSQECPFSAIELNEKKNPVLDPNRCRRCGICMGACPVQIISFEDYSVDMLSSMIRAVSMPEGDDEKIRVLVLACENDAYPALDMAGIQRLQYPANVRVIPVRCLGSVNSVLIADAMSRGFDGVALMGCKSGEDYQCHFIQGSELLGKRMDNVRETLKRLVLEPERVRVQEIAISDSGEIPAMLGEFVESVKKLGPNPFKGF